MWQISCPPSGMAICGGDARCTRKKLFASMQVKRFLAKRSSIRFTCNQNDSRLDDDDPKICRRLQSRLPLFFTGPMVSYFLPFFGQNRLKETRHVYRNGIVTGRKRTWLFCNGLLGLLFSEKLFIDVDIITLRSEGRIAKLSTLTPTNNGFTLGG